MGLRPAFSQQVILGYILSGTIVMERRVSRWQIKFTIAAFSYQTTPLCRLQLLILFQMVFWKLFNMKKDILSKEESLALYRKLILTRLAEEKIREEYFKDEMKTPVHLGIGGEAIPVGVCHCLPPRSKTFGTYRNHSLYLAMTEDTDGFFGELYGKVNGPGKGKAGSMHLSFPERDFIATSAVVGTTIPVAVGAALANAYRKSNDVVTFFFGDGAVEEGVFWESLNFACLKNLRVLFVCEDNGLAIHTPAKERQGFQSIL